MGAQQGSAAVDQPMGKPILTHIYPWGPHVCWVALVVQLVMSGWVSSAKALLDLKVASSSNVEFQSEHE